VDDPDLLLPGNMPARINAQLHRIGQASVPEGPDMAARMASLILHSLAARYAAVLRDAASITGKTLKRLYIVGGGSKNTRLNQLTAKATGLQVLTGSTESATVGNFAIQLAALEGNYGNGVGVSANAVAEWASRLAALPIGTQEIGAREIADREIDVPGTDVPGNTIPAHRVDGIQRPTGKVLA
jgi:rhamnulokinase